MADSRQYRSRFYLNNLVLLAILAGVLFFLNLNSDKASRYKKDLSADQLYTISPAAQQILSKLEDVVTVEYYVTDNLPKYMLTLQRDTVDMLEEFRRLSEDKLQYKVIDPSVEIDTFATEKTDAYLAKMKEVEKAPESEKADLLEELEEPKPPSDPMAMFRGMQEPTADQIRDRRDKLASRVAREEKREKDEVYKEILLDEWKSVKERKFAEQQIRPMLAQERTGDSVRQVRIYSSMVIKYLERPPEVIPQYQSLESLEYEIAHRVVKLTTVTKPVVAFYDARRREAPPQ